MYVDNRMLRFFTRKRQRLIKFAIVDNSIVSVFVIGAINSLSLCTNVNFLHIPLVINFVFSFFEGYSVEIFFNG